MTVIVPTSIPEALSAFGEHPEAVALAGGTDLLVEINEGHRQAPSTIVALDRVSDLTTWTIDQRAHRLRIGAGIRWAEIERPPLAELVPALAQAARTVGSPQIRNAGTVGGNLATCSPAGDGLPVLSALGATVHVVGAAGRRALPIDDFMVGVKRTALGSGELIEAVEVPLVEGFQGFSKVGVRNAMVIAAANACVVTDGTDVRIAVGSVAPTVIRCGEAERVASDAADWNARSIDPADARRSGELAAAASRPIDDHRSTAVYRRHAVAVMVERLLLRALPGTVAS